MSALKNKNFFSLDLELNNKNDGSVPKIIEVGISVGKPEEPENIQSFNWYINPQEPIAEFITQLTGITDELIQEKSVSHETAAKEIGDILRSYDCFVNPIVWGQGDASELKAEFKERNIHFPFFGNRIFDVKTLYVFRQMVKGNSPKSGLRRAMRNCGLEFIGTPHRAICDAENTLRFFFYYINKSRELEATLQKLRDT
jgi:inhibitor of KinA sporulation pathway (predicted exonuclease)